MASTDTGPAAASGDPPSKPLESTGSEVAAEEGSEGYAFNKAAPKAVEELLQKDSADESLKRYKEQLLGVAATKGDVGNKDDPRKVILTNFETIFEDQSLPKYLVQLEKTKNPAATESNDSKEKEKIKFELKEGSKYRVKLGFRVQHEIVSGLEFKWKVTRKMLASTGVGVTEKVVMGSYGPRSEVQWFEFPRNDWMEAPKGMVNRGEYKGTITLEDIDKVKHCEVKFSFKITK